MLEVYISVSGSCDIIFKNYENKEDYCEAKLQDSTFRKFKS